MVSATSKLITRRTGPAKIHAFALWQLSTATRELSCDGELVPLAPQSFALLNYLLDHADRALSPEELLSEVWPDSVVGEGSLRLAIHDIRRTLGDTGAEQRYVRTIRGKGYRFVATVETSNVSEPVLATDSVVVGRTFECGQIDDFFSAAWRGVRVCALVGPQGVGKSHLVRYAKERAEREGFRVVLGAPADQPDAEPLSPWPELLRGSLSSLSRAKRAHCQRLSPAVFKLLVDGEALPNEWISLCGFESQHEWLMDELSRLSEVCAEDQPMALFLDDIDRAQEPAVALLLHLASKTSSPPIAIFVSARDPAATQARSMRRALKHLGSLPSSLRIDLSGLSAAASLDLIAASSKALDPALALEVHKLSGGNPMFCLELVRYLEQLGPSRSSALSKLEGGLGEVVGRRLDMLHPEALRALVVASVLPQNFGVAQLAHLLKTTPHIALVHVEEAVRQGFARTYPELYQASFAHSMLRERANAMLSSNERAELHLLAAEWLEDVEGGEPHTLAQLALHYHAAAACGGARKAVSYARRCAQQVSHAGAFAEAVGHLERALACCDLARVSPLERLQLEIDKAEAQRLDAPSGRVHQDTLAMLAERASVAGSRELFVKAVLVYAGQTATRFAPSRFSASTDRRELELIERALSQVQEACSERALLLCALAYALVYTTSDERRSAACDEAVAIARSADQPWLLARALMMRSYVCAAPSDYERRISSCSELIALVEQHGFKELELEARLRRALCYLEGGDPHAAERDEVRATQLAQFLSSPRLRVRCELLELLRAFGSGRLERAEEMSARALDVHPNDPTARSIHLVRTASVRNVRLGMSTELVQMHEALVQAHPDTIGFRCSLASIYAAAGRSVEAGEQFDWVARGQFAALPKNLNWLSELSLLADTAVNLDDRERARRAHAALSPYANRWLIFAGEAAPGGPIAYWLCNLAATLRDYDLGKRWLARTRELVALMNAPLFARFADLAEARLRLACRPDEHPERAQALLSGVIEFADQNSLMCLRLCATDIGTRYRATQGYPDQKTSQPRQRS